MSTQRHRLLASLFWLCWLSAVLVPAAVMLAQYAGGWLLLDYLSLPLLCLLSAKCVRVLPILAKIGMFTLGAWLVAVPAYMIAYAFWFSKP
jgi:Mn2+/Fe2+ NRAMP family transporter